MRETRVRLSHITIALHWTIALAIVAMILFGMYVEDLERGEGETLLALHAAIARFFGSEESWRQSPGLDGFFMEREGARDTILGRFDGTEFRLDVAGGRVTYSGEGFSLSFHEDDPEATMEGECSGEVDLSFYHIMDLMRRAIYDSLQVNYINSLVSEEAE